MKESSAEQVAAGHGEVTRAWIQEHGASIRSLARRLTRNDADAEDATQEIYLTVWRNAGRYDPAKGSGRTFIMMIARRRLIDRRRKAILEPPMESMDVLDRLHAERTEMHVSSSLDDQRVLRLFAALPDDQREILELSMLDGLTQVEIAARLAKPLGTVKSSMRRGLIKLRELGKAPARDERVTSSG